MYRLYAGLDLIKEDRKKCSVFISTWHLVKGGGLFKSSQRQQAILQGCFTATVPPKNNTSKSQESLSKVLWAEEIVKQLEENKTFSDSGEDKSEAGHCCF